MGGPRLTLTFFTKDYIFLQKYMTMLYELTVYFNCHAVAMHVILPRKL